MKNKEFAKNGSAYIAAEIEKAVSDGSRRVYISGNYEIEQTVIIPSDIHLVLEDCHLRMACGSFCNMFRNERAKSGKRDEADKNIVIEGRGRAILDGGEYNGLSEKNHSTEGRPHISVNNILLFCNVDGFTVSGLHVRNQRWWALNFIFCRNGRIGNIDFLSDYTRIDGNGERTEGLLISDYPSVYLKNSDGIDLRAGCYNIIIENITGFTEDDTVALTALAGKLERELYNVEGLCPDIYNVIIRNVMSSAYCANVRLLNQSGYKLHNILIDGVMDTSKDSRYLDRGFKAVRIGDRHMYGKRHSTRDETYNITVKNVYSRAETVLTLAGEMSNIYVDNIRGFDGYGKLVENDAVIYNDEEIKL